ncbi:hypothetical protein R1sor_004782 [Riccia sorocarpa]|uniref:Uncharacterized protein n=1 Tax=Riccia sorocarpa TaxID=122646 RepID=A0ABD3HJW3_9MARC
MGVPDSQFVLAGGEFLAASCDSGRCEWRESARQQSPMSRGNLEEGGRREHSDSECSRSVQQLTAAGGLNARREEMLYACEVFGGVNRIQVRDSHIFMEEVRVRLQERADVLSRALKEDYPHSRTKYDSSTLHQAGNLGSSLENP